MIAAATRILVSFISRQCREARLPMIRIHTYASWGWHWTGLGGPGAYGFPIRRLLKMLLS